MLAIGSEWMVQKADGGYATVALLVRNLGILSCVTCMPMVVAHDYSKFRLFPTLFHVQ